MFSLLFNVFGGLAIFIYGMKLMSDGLNQSAGRRMKSILGLFTGNKYIAIVSGTVITAVIQSSSATTAMVIGFVNAGLLNLTQSIGIIFGANIGTTITAQIVAFKINSIIMPAIIIGVVMLFLSNKSIQNWGLTVAGFGFLFLGMMFMSDELKVLSDNPNFKEVFSLFDCAPINGYIPIEKLLGAIGIGLVTTLLIQSSSATTGIVIAMGASGLLNLYTAVALVLGSNIGTTITAQLAALAANRIAKQVALAHTLFNILGVIIISSTFYVTVGVDKEPIFFYIINNLSDNADLARQIANAHTVFNVITTLLLIPTIPLLVKLCEKIIPIKEKNVGYQRLELHLLDTPSLAINQTIMTLRYMLVKSFSMVDCAFKLYTINDEKTKKKSKKLSKREKKIDEIQEQITDYLSRLMQQNLTNSQTQAIPILLHCTNDAERIGDHTEIILDLVEKFQSSQVKLDSESKQEIKQLQTLLTQQAVKTSSLLNKFNENLYNETIMLTDNISKEISKYENKYLQRVQKKVYCSVSGLFFVEMMGELKKVSHHIGNIAERTKELCDL